MFGVRWKTTTSHCGMSLYSQLAGSKTCPHLGQLFSLRGSSLI